MNKNLEKKRYKLVKELSREYVKKYGKIAISLVVPVSIVIPLSYEMIKKSGVEYDFFEACLYSVGITGISSIPGLLVTLLNKSNSKISEILNELDEIDSELDEELYNEIITEHSKMCDEHREQVRDYIDYDINFSDMDKKYNKKLERKVIINEEN